mmetsp:Transcript_35512/g.42396  ORF Transcript_35512/g.42396 Transcript_35512/m.42396 type:complete len:199 (-) Transcript_35512:217-813(-)
MTTPSFRSAVDENLSAEELTKAREEFHDKLRAGYEGNECADLGVNFQLCLFDSQVQTRKLKEESSSSSGKTKVSLVRNAFSTCKDPHLTAFKACLKNRSQDQQPYLGGRQLTDQELEERKARIQRMIDERKEAGVDMNKEEFLRMSKEIQKDDAVRIQTREQEEKDEGTSSSSLAENLRRASVEADGAMKKPWYRAVF